jgi:hypothetical protein
MLVARLECGPRALFDRDRSVKQGVGIGNRISDESRHGDIESRPASAETLEASTRAPLGKNGSSGEPP